MKNASNSKYYYTGTERPKNSKSQYHQDIEFTKSASQITLNIKREK